MGHVLPRNTDRDDHLFADTIVMLNDRVSPVRNAAPAPQMQSAYSRYCDRRMDWRTRVFGLGGTVSVFLLLLGCAVFTWRAVHPTMAPPALAVFDVSPPAAPPDPVQEVPDGPQQVEQKKQTPKEENRPKPPEIIIPRLSPITVSAEPAAEPAKSADPVPETTAPKSVPAPPAHRAANNAQVTWESKLLAHLEKYRRYPAAARSRREQGIAHVTFRMNLQGRVLSATLARSSGSALLDRAALETVRRAQPLPSIPDDRPDVLELSVPVEFFVR